MPAPRAKPELAPEQVEEVREAFNLFDSDGSGSIDYRELKAAIKALGLHVKKAELRTMITNVDANACGTVTFAEFLTMMSAKIGPNDTRPELKKVFDMFDDDASGMISFANLKRVAKELGENMTDEELQVSFACAVLMCLSSNCACTRVQPRLMLTLAA